MTLLNPILQTKFYPPPVISDYVERNEIDSKLNNSVSTPVLLVSAPTGFGKSTFVSNWLQKNNKNFAWLSLGEQEDDFQRFINYFTYAIHQKYKSFGQNILELDSSVEMPTPSELAEHFIDFFSELDEQLYLIIDDYHQIRNREIHKFISKLFSYTSNYFQLVIITRRDPALPLSDWRAKNILTEIRASDLRFNSGEILKFFSDSVGFNLNSSSVKVVENSTDGWISVIRLLILSLKNKSDLNEELSNVYYRKSHIFQRLLFDVIHNLPKKYQQYLLKLSLVKEFNANLFAELCLTAEEIKDKDDIFNKFIFEITNSNLFIIALDNKHNWYRFHHLIVEMLQNHLQETVSGKEFKELKLQVANWYLTTNNFESALKNILDAENYNQAVSLFSQIKNTLLSNSQWLKLEQIFNWFPNNIIENYTILLLAKAWLFIYKGNIQEMLNLIQPIEKLIETERFEENERANLIGELHMLKAWDRYNFNIDMEACLHHGNEAIRLIKLENSYALGLAWVFYGGAMQTMKRSEDARQNIYKLLAKNIHFNLKSNLYLVLCYMDWMDGNLVNLLKSARQLEKLGNEFDSKETVANSKYFKGLALYFLNEIESAKKELETAVQYQHFTILVHSFFSMTALAFIFQEQGNIEATDRLVDRMETVAIEKGGAVYVQFAKAFSSELLWKQKSEQNALKWAKENSFKPFFPMISFCSIQLSQITILALDENPDSWKLALSNIDEILSFIIKTNNTNFLIRITIVKAVLQYKSRNTTSAFSSLKSILIMASERSFIKPFLEFKKEINILFSEFREEVNSLNLNNEFLDKISQSILKTSLTNREIEILQSFDEKLSNKELGIKLFISEKTVKRHIANIFKKLQATNRRDAIEKAQKLNVTN